MPDQRDYFRCPICRGLTCERVTVPRANNNPYVTTFYACTTCTVMFLDPLAFTRGFEDRPQNGQRPARVTSFAAHSLINQTRKDRSGGG